MTEGSIEKGNQDVKQTQSRFVARISMENIHRNSLHRLSWEADPILHYEWRAGQVRTQKLVIFLDTQVSLAPTHVSKY